MKKATPSVNANKDRLAYMFGSLVGQKVVVKLKSLVSYEGVFCGCQNDKGDYTILLRHAHELPSETRLSGPVVDQFVIPGKEILMMSGMDIPDDVSGSDDKKSGAEFRTDSEINKHSSSSPSGQAPIRPLETWTAAAGENVDMELDMSSNSAGWSGAQEQFEVARKMGVVSTYKEDLYTTPLDYSKLTSEQRSRAEKLAKEIEGSGRSYAAQEEGTGNDDEEAAFSAVIGTGGYKQRGAAPAPHPVNTASSWRTPPNTKLNALNLEPATAKPVHAAQPKLSSALPEIPPHRSAARTTQSSSSALVAGEMKSINALNLEPAATRDVAPRRGVAPKPASSPQESKRQFQIALESLKGKAPAAPANSTAAAAAAAAAHAAKFSFNPNASTFTPGGPGPNPNTLNISVTPGGSLAGSLKSANNYEYYEHGAAPMVPPMMYMPHPPQYGMMPPPPVVAPTFSPFSDAEPTRFDLHGAMNKLFTVPDAPSTGSWGGSTSSSFKDILGQIPAGLNPIPPMHPGMHHPGMHHPMQMMPGHFPPHHYGMPMAPQAFIPSYPPVRGGRGGGYPMGPQPYMYPPRGGRPPGPPDQ